MPSLSGQWLGTIQGEPSGWAMVDLEQRSNEYTGSAIFRPDDPNSPSTLVPEIAIPLEKLSHDTTVSLQGFDNITKQPIPIYDASSYSKEYLHPQKAEISISLIEENKIKINFSTEVSKGHGYLCRCPLGNKSTWPADTAVSTWDDFKRYLTEIRSTDYVFRGQREPWCLQTSFHRAGRCDLQRYQKEDIAELRKDLLSFFPIFYDTQRPDILGGLYNLAQHHGFPTPLLDWTRSPYVAAFFAFRGIPSITEAPEHKYVRIFLFNAQNWPSKDTNQAYVINTEPHITVLDLLPIANPRSLPQQAVAMLTNLKNIEHYVQYMTSKDKPEIPYLTAFDIPWSEREHVLTDLREMGITASSMFPGLDGICEDVKGRFY